MVEGAVSFGLEYRISERFSVAGRQALSASVTRGTVTYTGKEAADDEGGRERVLGRAGSLDTDTGSVFLAGAV